MTGGHQCSFVAKMNWRKAGSSSHPIVHVLSSQQNCCASPSNTTVAWLVGTSGAHRGEDFRLTVGEARLGSGWDSDIVLTSPEVSRTHSKITSTGHFCIIEDLESASGVFVNDERMSDPRTLNHGDRLKIGMGEFIYVSLELNELAGQQHQRVSALPAIESAKLQRMPTQAWLICQNGELQGLDFRLTTGVNRVGSLPGLEATIPDPNLQSLHMNIECSRDRIYLRPVSSDVRVLRNKLLIDPGVLKDGDSIQVGALILRLRCLI